MPRLSADLHNHGPLIPEDYRGKATTSGEEMVRTAMAAGLDIFALTDHFSVDFFTHVERAAAKIASEQGAAPLVLPGMELRLTHDGEETHLVVILPPDAHRLVAETLLASVGLEDACSGVGLHRVVLDVDPVVVAHAAFSFGAIVNVAHADRWFGERRVLGTGHLERVLEDAPITAVELLDPLTEIELGRHMGTLPVVHSSDSHCNDEIGRRRTIVDVDEVSFEGLREALAAHRVVRS